MAADELMDWYPPPPPPPALLTAVTPVATVVVTVDCSLLPVDVLVVSWKLIEGESIPEGVLGAVIFRDSGSAMFPPSSNPGSYLAPSDVASGEEAWICDPLTLCLPLRR